MARFNDSPSPVKKRPSSSRYRVEQREITFRGRVFHFVSYDATEARKGQPATEPAWYLMNEGTRWEVMPHLPEQDAVEVERELIAWLDRTLSPSSGK